MNATENATIGERLHCIETCFALIYAAASIEDENVVNLDDLRGAIRELAANGRGEAWWIRCAAGDQVLTLPALTDDARREREASPR